jgi:hypothetical protein
MVELNLLLAVSISQFYRRDNFNSRKQPCLIISARSCPYQMLTCLIFFIKSSTFNSVSLSQWWGLICYWLSAQANYLCEATPVPGNSHSYKIILSVFFLYLWKPKGLIIVVAASKVSLLHQRCLLTFEYRWEGRFLFHQMSILLNFFHWRGQINWSVCPWNAFPASQIFIDKDRSLSMVLHSSRLRRYLQILD